MAIAGDPFTFYVQTRDLFDRSLAVEIDRPSNRIFESFTYVLGCARPGPKINIPASSLFCLLDVFALLCLSWLLSSLSSILSSNSPLPGTPTSHIPPGCFACAGVLTVSSGGERRSYVNGTHSYVGAGVYKVVIVLTRAHYPQPIFTEARDMPLLHSPYFAQVTPRNTF